MDGAIQAGERAARECLRDDGLLSPDLVWQEEPVSLEFPPLPPSSSSWFELYAPSPSHMKNAVKRATMTAVLSLVGYLAIRNRDLLQSIKF